MSFTWIRLRASFTWVQERIRRFLARVMPRPVSRGGVRQFRPQLEVLEGRLAPAMVYDVTSAADDNTAGTFRVVLNQAIANPGSTIDIKIPGGGTQVITLTRGVLPTISVPMTINGFTQANTNGAPAVEIDGANLTADGLTITSGGVTIEGLAVDNFNGNGIVLSNPLGTSDLIEGCYAGVDLTGLKKAPNTGDGLLITGADNTIGAGVGSWFSNIFSGNGGNGIHLSGSGALRNTFAGNLAGVDNTGKTALANGSSGILLDVGSGNNTIGGAVDDINILSGNASAGIYVFGSNSNQVLGNYIGLGSDGSTIVANGQDGVTMFNGSSNNIIGGGGGYGGNVISGNGRDGVLVGNPGATGNKILGNKIGTDYSGVVAKPNQKDGVAISGTSSNFIGGTNPGEGNTISGNLGNGITLDTANNNLVASNYVGTDATGTAPLGNKKDGILITGNNNTIGVAYTGTDQTHAHPSNVISANSLAGVEIRGGSLNSLVNNYISTDVTGLKPLGNTAYGVELDLNTVTGLASINNSIGTPAVTNTQTANVISANGQGNEIGNQGYGVYISGTGTTGNVVQGDYIGVTWQGTAGTPSLGNGNDGVYLEPGADGNTIGGTTAAAGNIISDNGTQQDLGIGAGYGVDASSKNNLIEYDTIGLDINGKPLPNKNGWRKGVGGTGNVWLNDTHQ